MTSLKAAEVATRTSKAMIASRAVHINVTPSPEFLHERRGILRVLKQFGEVIMFRSLKDDPESPAHNVILAMFEQADSAKRLISEAPLQFTVEPPPKPRPNSSIETLDLFHTERNATHSGRQADGAQSEREFYLTADASHMDHLARMHRQKYYWGFDITRRTFVQDDLAKTVPTLALSDMQLHPSPIHQRVATRNQADIAKQTSLKDLWHQGQRDRERNFPGNV